MTVQAQKNESNGTRGPDKPSLDFTIVDEMRVPQRSELARERMLSCRLYLGLIQTMNGDCSAEFVRHSDGATLRTIGTYVFVRTVMCSPVRANTIAQVLKIPRMVVLSA